MPCHGRVRPLGVVIGDPPREASPQLGTGLRDVQVDAFVFDRAPQPLNEDIVHPADQHIGIAQHVGKGKAGRLEKRQDFAL